MTDSPISNVSDTALWVAAFRAQESERSDALFHDPLASALVGEKGRAIAREMPYPKILAWTMAVRTVAIDRLIKEAIAAGIDTVVNIGAGLDTRPYRMDLPKDLHWIEIDFPHMMDMKTTRLAKEKPRIRLSHHGLDFSSRTEAQRLYEEIGSQTKRALIITEGVIPYLSADEAGQLAQDLHRVPSFKFWIQDYRQFNKTMVPPKKLSRKLKNAPFRFQHVDPLGFFRSFGWKVRSDIKAMDEARKLGRPFPIPFPWNYLLFLIPKDRREKAKQSMGYVLLESVTIGS